MTNVDRRPNVSLAVAYRWLLFAALFAAIVVPALFGFANPITQFLSVWAYALLAPRGFVAESDVGDVVYLQEYGWIVALTFWALVGLSYSWLARRMRPFHFLLLTYPVILTVFYVMAYFLYFLGVEHAPE